MKKCFLILEENYSSKIALNDIAEALHANSSYLSRLFKQKSGNNLFDAQCWNAGLKK